MSFHSKIIIQTVPFVVSLFGRHALVATPKTVAAIVLKAIKGGEKTLVIKTKFGCDCELTRIFHALRRSKHFEFVQLKGKTIEVNYSRRLNRRAA